MWIKTLTSRAGIPTLFFLASNAVLGLVAHQAGLSFWNSSSWLRRDSGHYLSIAQQGYKLFPCSQLGGAQDQWCGNAGWFPAYPWLIKLVAPIFSFETSAVILSALFLWGLFFLLWNLFFADHPSDGIAPMGLASVFPGMIYSHAGFPISMCLFLMLLYSGAYNEDRWALIGVSGFLLGLVYPTGILLPCGLLGYTIIRWRTLLHPWRLFFLSHVLPILGLTTCFLFQSHQTGAWDAFFKVQAKYRIPHLYPFEILGLWIKPLWSSSHPTIFMAPPLQTVVLGIFILCLFWHQWKTRTSLERFGGRFDDWLLFTGIVYFLLPYVRPAHLAFYRAESLLLPCTLPLLRRQVRLSWIFTLPFGVISMALAFMFFKDWLN